MKTPQNIYESIFLNLYHIQKRGIHFLVTKAKAIETEKETGKQKILQIMWKHFFLFSFQFVLQKQLLIDAYGAKPNFISDSMRTLNVQIQELFEKHNKIKGISKTC